MTSLASTRESTELEVSQRYLELLKRVLLRQLGGEPQRAFNPGRPLVRHVSAPLRQILGKAGLEIVHRTDETARLGGTDWPAEAETMIGEKRLDNLEYCVRTVCREKIAGDLVECGVWRGGAAIFMRAMLSAFGERDRSVWLADSFEGLPRPDEERFPADANDRHHTFTELAVSIEEVKGNFEKYGLLDDQVKFLKGWFADTLAQAPIEDIAVLRLDGDMYGSTLDALTSLYDKVVPEGFVIIDDYILDGCRRAVHDFRKARGINDEIIPIDGIGVFWRRSE